MRVHSALQGTNNPISLSTFEPTHMSHEVSHADRAGRLPESVELAYDGLQIELDDGPEDPR